MQKTLLFTLLLRSTLLATIALGVGWAVVLYLAWTGYQGKKGK